MKRSTDRNPLHTRENGERNGPCHFSTARRVFYPSASEQQPHRQHLVDDDLALHAGSLVGLAVVVVLSGNIELAGNGLTRGVQVVLVGEGIGVDSGRDGILIEHDVVRESGVVGPRDAVSLGDGDRRRLEDERSVVGSLRVKEKQDEDVRTAWRRLELESIGSDKAVCAEIPRAPPSGRARITPSASILTSRCGRREQNGAEDDERDEIRGRTQISRKSNFFPRSARTSLTLAPAKADPVRAREARPTAADWASCFGVMAWALTEVRDATAGLTDALIMETDCIVIFD